VTPPVYRGKVRDVIDAGDHLVMVTSDRISAFDRPLGEIPGKGEVLNQLALYWFEETSDLVENHILESLGPRSVAVNKAEMVPVEVVVRGYLTGSAWKEYAAGRSVPGLKVGPGMRAHQRLEVPQITPTTKAPVGEHDEPIDPEGILARGLCSPELWTKIEKTALKLFARGQEVLAQRGLILVDTKYEFGLVEGRLVLCDEVHTPDCSRFWFADDYEAAFAAGREPKKLDKEYLRNWLAGQGFTGHGPVPRIPAEVFEETKKRYVEAFERITGRNFAFSGVSAQAELDEILSDLTE
jgi:phosphoribosylaminoimidazole-succinocarboxamide synthase